MVSCQLLVSFMMHTDELSLHIRQNDTIFGQNRTFSDMSRHRGAGPPVTFPTFGRRAFRGAHRTRPTEGQSCAFVITIEHHEMGNPQKCPKIGQKNLHSNRIAITPFARFGRRSRKRSYGDRQGSPPRDAECSRVTKSEMSPYRRLLLRGRKMPPF